MRYMLLFLIVWPLFGQNQVERKKQVQEQTLTDLRQAEKKKLEEQQLVLTREQHVLSLLQELETNKKILSEKEEELLALLRKSNEKIEKKSQATRLELPSELIDHYQSRDPKVAAKDFMKLYKDKPEVAIALIRQMKKKKSAKLIDMVVQLDQKNGTKIAAGITAAIGEGIEP